MVSHCTFTVVTKMLIILFSLFSADRPTVINADQISETQQDLTLVLQNYCSSDVHPGKNPGGKRLCVSVSSFLNHFRTVIYSLLLASHRTAYHPSNSELLHHPNGEPEDITQ